MFSDDRYKLQLSTIFTEARLKTLIEVRTPDATDCKYALSFPALLKGVLYDEGVRGELDKELDAFSIDQVIAAHKQAAMVGMSEAKYGEAPMLAFCERLVSAGAQGLQALGSDEACFLEPLQEQVLERRCSPGEELKRDILKHKYNADDLIQKLSIVG